LRGGQGGEVRLKLYLTMSLLAVGPPFDIKPIPARSWAAALDIDGPAHNGARRVSDAIGWLVEHKLLLAERRQGAPGTVRLLSQDGTGGPYTRPTPSARYVRLPLGIWDEGWIVRLSGTALALLIVLLDLQGGRAGTTMDIVGTGPPSLRLVARHLDQGTTGTKRPGARHGIETFPRGHL
jgi:hypothetical protein